MQSVIVFIKSVFLTPQYVGSIVENTQGMEVMRFKAYDLDMKNTANWEAIYHISKGNEAGYFSIKTDPVTNEGILMLDKVKKTTVQATAAAAAAGELVQL